MGVNEVFEGSLNETLFNNMCYDADSTFQIFQMISECDDCREFIDEIDYSIPLLKFAETFNTKQKMELCQIVRKFGGKTAALSLERTFDQFEEKPRNDSTFNIEELML